MISQNLAFLLCLTIATNSLSIEVPSCTAPPTPTLKPFRNTINGDPEYDSETTAGMCHDDKYLYISWWCKDTEIISTYNNCNDPLYNQDAV